MKPMTATEQEQLREQVLVIRGALSALRLSRVTDEDVEVAKARLDEWLTTNDGRWVK